MKQNVAILGATDKKDRYAYRAFQLLKLKGYNPLLVSPKVSLVDGVPVKADLSQITEAVDTLTMYVSAGISTALVEKILKLKPRRIVFNPGSENPAIEPQLKKAGIEVTHGCTLVMLNTGQF